MSSSFIDGFRAAALVGLLSIFTSSSLTDA